MEETEVFSEETHSDRDTQEKIRTVSESQRINQLSESFISAF